MPDQGSRGILEGRQRRGVERGAAPAAANGAKKHQRGIE
jgi:hypothetical protein